MKINKNEYTLLGEPYSYGDYEGLVNDVIEDGSFRGCYQVKLTHKKDKTVHYWYFKKHILEDTHRKEGLIR